MTAVSDSDKVLAELRSKCDTAEGMLEQLRADTEKGVKEALGDCLMENARDKIITERVAVKARMAGIEAKENPRICHRTESICNRIQIPQGVRTRPRDQLKG